MLTYDTAFMDSLNHSHSGNKRRLFTIHAWRVQPFSIFPIFSELPWQRNVSELTVLKVPMPRKFVLSYFKVTKENIIHKGVNPGLMTSPPHFWHGRGQSPPTFALDPHFSLILVKGLLWFSHLIIISVFNYANILKMVFQCVLLPVS